MTETCRTVAGALDDSAGGMQIIERHSGFFSEVFKVGCTTCSREHYLAIKTTRPEAERHEIAIRQELFPNEVEFYQSAGGRISSVPNLRAAELSASKPVIVLDWLDGRYRQFFDSRSAEIALHGYCILQDCYADLNTSALPRETELHTVESGKVFEAATRVMADDLRNHGYSMLLDDTSAWARENFSAAFSRVYEQGNRRKTLLHCDLRADNMLQTQAGFSFLDWQRWSVGWPAIDVATLLSQSVTFKTSAQFINFITQAARKWPPLELPSKLTEWLDLILVVSFGPVVGYRLPDLNTRETELIRGSVVRALKALSALLMATE